MTKCKECGLENDHKMSCDAAFDEDAWDKQRLHYEREVKIAVMNLRDFMGSNSFTLPFSKFTVVVTPSDA